MTTRPPSEREIDARIRVKEEHADAAYTAFERAGFTPIYVERRADGAVSFWFGKDVQADLYRVVTAIPREWYAIQGIVH
jgi:hypothetical protein